MINKKAYAKINLFLNVLDKRKDGYHNLEMINAKIDLCDDIVLKKCEKSTGIIIKSNDLFLSNQDNVILQCARFIQDKYHINYGIKIIIDKKIPYGAGLGGNSTDAATVIKGINELAELNLSLEEMKKIGNMFGADIPYCLYDEVSYVTSIGENIKPIENKLKGTNILIAHPKKHILTASVFEIADKEGYQAKNIEPVMNAIKNNDIGLLQKKLYNSLEHVVINMDEEMNAFKMNLIKSVGANGVVMTGSGSTFIKVLEDVNDDVKRFVKENQAKILVNIYKII
ncbi:MAG: 4-(cytidine 5'-diphospho)-2-C-methyl-D-erythritol kinase [Tenericutes bacterium]|jgi:4-diphosphocytidyl-2-C-methyl-D-erythritol kinase|nr:4-(cytidine 5'-diphospho)-2-C-methyl-D-erythritol kinase [Mycoplasmatota bacterium]